MDKFSLKEQQRIARSFDKLWQFKDGVPLERVLKSVKQQYPIKRYSEMLGYNSGMEKYKQELQIFVSNIKNKTISKNEVAIGKIDNDVKDFLHNKSIVVETDEIFISVKHYNHALRDFKKSIGKAVPETVMNEVYNSINNPKNIYFNTDTNKLNLLYIDNAKDIVFKVVVKPNYKTKKGYKNYILSAGIIQLSDLKKKNYIKIR